MDLINICIISLCAVTLVTAVALLFLTASVRTLKNSNKVLSDKVADLRCRINENRTAAQKALARSIQAMAEKQSRNESKQMDEKSFCGHRASGHALHICSSLTDAEKGILLEVVRFTDNSDTEQFNSCRIPNDRYFTGLTYCRISRSEMQDVLEKLQKTVYWHVENNEPEYIEILEDASVPSSALRTTRSKWQRLISWFWSDSDDCGMIRPVFTRKAQNILLKPLLKAYRSGQIRHIDDFDLLRIELPNLNNQNRQEENTNSAEQAAVKEASWN